MEPESYEHEQVQDRNERMMTVLATVGVMLSALSSLSEQMRRDFPEVLPPPAPPASAAVDALRTENRQLKEALEGRAVIERAKGVIMATHGCDDGTAFDILVARSRRERRKVRAVAADLLGQFTGNGEPAPATAGQPAPPSAGQPAPAAAPSPDPHGAPSVVTPLRPASRPPRR